MRLFYCFCVLALLYCQPVPAAPAPPEGTATQPAAEKVTILARVNGAAITERQVLRRLQAVHGDVESYRQDAGRWRRMLEAGIEAEVRDRLLLQAARKADLVVDNREVEQERERARRLLGEEGFRAMLEKRGSTETDFDVFLRERLLIDRYKAGLFSDVTVDEDTLRSYYDGHRDILNLPRSAQLETWLVEDAGAADDLLASLRGAGEAAAPEGRSGGTGAAPDSGQRREVVIEDLPPALRTLLETAGAGDVLEPVEENGRLRIIRVLAVEEARPLSFEEARESLRDLLIRRRQEARLEDWYASTSKDAIIDYLPLP